MSFNLNPMTRRVFIAHLQMLGFKTLEEYDLWYCDKVFVVLKERTDKVLDQMDLPGHPPVAFIKRAREVESERLLHNYESAFDYINKIMYD